MQIFLVNTEIGLDVVIVITVISAPLLGIGAGRADKACRLVKGVRCDVLECIRQSDQLYPGIHKSTGADRFDTGSDRIVFLHRYAHKGFVPDLLERLRRPDIGPGRRAEAENRDEQQNREYGSSAYVFHATRYLLYVYLVNYAIF